jgi:hypothetical protein
MTAPAPALSCSWQAAAAAMLAARERAQQLAPLLALPPPAPALLQALQPAAPALRLKRGRLLPASLPLSPGPAPAIHLQWESGF